LGTEINTCEAAEFWDSFQAEIKGGTLKKKKKKKKKKTKLRLMADCG